MAPTRLNIYGEDSVFVWLLMDPEDGLRVREDDDVEALGYPPAWLVLDMLHDVSWDDVLDFRTNTTERAWRAADGALREGLAPGQPFLVRAGRPHHYRSDTMNGVEYDVDYDLEIVRVLPVDPAKVLAEWSAEYEATRAGVLERDAEATRRRLEAETDTSKMYLRFDHFFGPGEPYWDEMSPPRAVSYTLHGGDQALQLAHGVDHDGDHARALDRLVADAALRVPHLSAEFVRAAPRRHRW